ncbi:hypothetical protein M1446_03540 [Candidatus Dependentiae bacterium]|nr:hypothetical protein [Candidatus Dependentiae bacterium]
MKFKKIFLFNVFALFNINCEGLAELMGKLNSQSAQVSFSTKIKNKIQKSTEKAKQKYEDLKKYIKKNKIKSALIAGSTLYCLYLFYKPFEVLDCGICYEEHFKFNSYLPECCAKKQVICSGCLSKTIASSPYYSYFKCPFCKTQHDKLWFSLTHRL